MKRLLILISILGTTSATAQNPIITDILNDVNIDTLIWYSSDISGDRGVTAGGVTDTIRSRHQLEPGNELAYRYCAEKLQSFGLPIDSLLFGGTGKNLMATQVGSVYPNQFYIICGHYDALPYPGTYAPAADDDGSGTAAVLEAARVLSGYEFEYTIVYALWDEEEQGLVGSAAYANQANVQGDSLLGVINMDALAWDGDGDDLARVHTRPIANSVAIADTVIACNTDYGIGLNMVINNPGATYSDHSSFWNTAFSAVLIIEDFDNDGNPHYHTVTDKVEFFDTTYFEKLSKLSFATVATLAVPIGPVGVIETPRDLQVLVHPNPMPMHGQSQLYCELPFPGELTMETFDINGRKLASVSFGTQSGTFMEVLDALDVSPGMYTIQLTLRGKRETRTGTIRLQIE